MQRPTAPVSTARHDVLRLVTCGVLAALALAYGGVVAATGPSLQAMAENWPFVFVGLAGATVANSTGVGGGVVFVPAFAALEQIQGVPLTPSQIVAMSFVIQSFGMTVGSLTWLNKRAREPAASAGLGDDTFWRMVLVIQAPCLVTLVATQYLLELDQGVLFYLFKVFSLTMGLALLASHVSPVGRGAERGALGPVDLPALAVIGALGGVATALFSVGVGEFAALYLFLRGFPMTTCVPVAVVCSALTVVAGAPYGIVHENIPWAVLACVIPGVLVGGFVARRVAYFLGAQRLKLFTALWIIGSSLVLIIAY